MTARLPQTILTEYWETPRVLLEITYSSLAMIAMSQEDCPYSAETSSPEKQKQNLTGHSE
jgi:hypothetical protein